MSTSKKIITVLGATGAQGGGLVRSIMNDAGGEFTARAVTRDTNSDKAKALAALGAEVVAGDVDDEASLARAFAGAHGAYCVTFFWAHFSPDKELAEVRAMVGAAKKAGLKHVIWSTLEDTRKQVKVGSGSMPVLMEKYNVPHFDAKGEANAFFAEAGVPTTFLHTSFYWDNFITFGMGPKVGEDGQRALMLPLSTKKLPGIAAEDIGRCAHGIFKQGDDLIGKTVGIAGEHLTGDDMAAAFTNAYGEEVVYQDVPLDVYRGLGFPGAEDLGSMFQFKQDFNADYCALRSLEFSRSVNPKLQTFVQWLEANHTKIPRV